MADPLAEYTVRDFSAVDRQIEQIAERERVVTQKLRLANLFQIKVCCNWVNCELASFLYSSA